MNLLNERDFEDRTPRLEEKKDRKREESVRREKFIGKNLREGWRKGGRGVGGKEGGGGPESIGLGEKNADLREKLDSQTRSSKSGLFSNVGPPLKSGLCCQMEFL